jgi:hypothetical protein
MSVTITADIGPAIERLASLGARADVALAAGSLAGAEAAGELLKPAIEDHTPVDTGGLQASTSDPEIEDAGTTHTVTIRQTKRVGTKQWALAPLLLDGHRIVTRSGIDTGRSTDPNDYVAAALDEIGPEMQAAVNEAVHAAIRAALGGL